MILMTIRFFWIWRLWQRVWLPGTVFIAIESDDIFTSSTLRKIASLEEELTALPG